MKKKYPISFVIPIYKSERTIRHVIDEIHSVKQFNWEAILVNDSSPDNVDGVIKKLIAKYPKKIQYIQLSKNGGQQPAILHGFRYITKSIIATIDDDGQNPPYELLKMIDILLKDDLDIVYGEIKQKHTNIFRHFSSIANQYMSTYTIQNTMNIPISNVRVMRDYIAKSMAEASGQNNYIEGLAFLLTDRISSIPIQHRERFTGTSSYTAATLVALWLNQIIGYSNISLKIISTFSLIISISAFIIGVIYFFTTVNKPNRLTGWLSIYLTLTIMFSVLFLILSIVVEYIGRIYTKIHQPNVRIVRKKYP